MKQVIEDTMGQKLQFRIQYFVGMVIITSNKKYAGIRI